MFQLIHQSSVRLQCNIHIRNKFEDHVDQGISKCIMENSYSWCLHNPIISSFFASQIYFVCLFFLKNILNPFSPTWVLELYGPKGRLIFHWWKCLCHPNTWLHSVLCKFSPAFLYCLWERSQAKMNQVAIDLFLGCFHVPLAELLLLDG